LEFRDLFPVPGGLRTKKGAAEWKAARRRGGAVERRAGKRRGKPDRPTGARDGFAVRGWAGGLSVGSGRPLLRGPKRGVVGPRCQSPVVGMAGVADDGAVRDKYPTGSAAASRSDRVAPINLRLEITRLNGPHRKKPHTPWSPSLFSLCFLVDNRVASLKSVWILGTLIVYQILFVCQKNHKHVLPSTFLY
jgi:hypothetical protein